MDWLVSILYGFVSGLGMILPVSTDAHDYLLELMTDFNTRQPLMQFGIHMASLAALCFFCRHRLSHIYREMHLASLPVRKRKRYPDTTAVLDGKIVLTMLVPAAIGVLLTRFVANRCGSLPLLSLFLLLSGLVIYLPHFLQGANRDSRHLSRLEAVCFGTCAGLSAFPGVSRTGMVLSVGAMRGCGRSYLLDIMCVMMVPLLAWMSLLDLFGLFAVGVGFSLAKILQYALCAAAAFGGTSLAIASMRFLVVNRGYIMFSYYNWTLSVFSFILYLMI